MAILNGIVRFSGQLGDLVFYQRGKKNVVRQKTTNHQLSENSKKSGRDFGEVSRNAAYIRKAFATLVRLYAHGDLLNRLNKRVHEIFRTVSPELSGRKKMIDGNISLLQGFEFNAATSLSTLLFISPTAKLDSDGSLLLTLPKVEMKKFVRTETRSDTVILQVMVFNYGLIDGDYELFHINDMKFDLNMDLFPGAQLTVKTDQVGEKALLIAVGISYCLGNTRSGDRRYFACKITHAWHLDNGIEIKFIAQQPKEIKEETAQGGLSWTLG
ncbi:hypothetical protein [Pedobacter mucosus]|uniref:hypothetical protein n=1 Tax=Pedobacter mucosus TaxID=2895286 RepID=UPI001EE43554|nr:hypothetical protein [Pedobacter mucosus]UKT65451.1 hypothetical protein LOK61_06605 [Pedobacter mucosus]